MTKIKFNKVEYTLKFTLGFWEKVKADVNVTQDTIENRLKEDFGTVASAVIFYGIMYGLPKEDRTKILEDQNINIETLKEELDGTVIDAIEEAVIEGMSKVQKEMVAIAKQRQQDDLQKMKDGEEKPKDDDQKK